jgi:hypothetical protein
MSDLDEALVGIICQIWKVLKAADTELQAYKKAIKDCLETSDLAAAESLNAYVTSYRQSSALQAEMTEKYALILETLLRPLSDELLQTDQLLERLRHLEKL